MTDFRQLSDAIFASPQISLADIEAAKAAGISTIVNNRPDGEDPSAPQGEDIAAAAEAAELDYVAIPIGHSGFSEPQIDQMIRPCLLPLGDPFDAAVGLSAGQGRRGARFHRQGRHGGGLRRQPDPPHA